MPRGTERVFPDAMLSGFEALIPALRNEPKDDVVVNLVEEQASDLRAPPVSVDELLATLVKMVPDFVAHVKERRRPR